MHFAYFGFFCSVNHLSAPFGKESIYSLSNTCLLTSSKGLSHSCFVTCKNKATSASFLRQKIHSPSRFPSLFLSSPGLEWARCYRYFRPDCSPNRVSLLLGQVLLVSAEAPALSDQGPLTVKCSEPSVWGFFPQFYIVFKFRNGVLLLPLDHQRVKESQQHINNVLLWFL